MAKELEGQMSLFGIANEFQGTGKTAVKEHLIEEELSVSEELSKEEEVIPVKEKQWVSGEAMHPSMQKSFLKKDGTVASIAYVDYNKIYEMNFEGEVSLVHYKTSKEAVNAYMTQLENLREQDGVKESQDHPSFVDAEMLEVETERD